MSRKTPQSGSKERGKSLAKEISKPYEPTAREREAAANVRAAKGAIPSLKAETKDGKAEVSFDHPNSHYAIAVLMDAIGAHDSAVFRGLVSQIGNACTKGGEMGVDDANFMMAAMKDIAPRDTVETMLASQMAATQVATMTLGRRLAQAETIPQQDSAERAFNKLARTFTTQMEALRKHRTGGQQKVTVEHFTVNEGGQAIVGSVATGGRRHGKS